VTSDIDILRSAFTLVQQHGAEAERHAAERVNAMEAAGDEAGRAIRTTPVTTDFVLCPELGQLTNILGQETNYGSDYSDIPS
jgi:hypothetical protein